MAADFQSKHPNPCKLSSEGHFGSKFVTVVVTGKCSQFIYAYTVYSTAVGLMCQLGCKEDM